MLMYVYVVLYVKPSIMLMIGNIVECDVADAVAVAVVMSLSWNLVDDDVAAEKMFEAYLQPDGLSCTFSTLKVQKG